LKVVSMFIKYCGGWYLGDSHIVGRDDDKVWE
jgi:hypothetical protein